MHCFTFVCSVFFQKFSRYSQELAMFFAKIRIYIILYPELLDSCLSQQKSSNVYPKLLDGSRILRLHEMKPPVKKHQSVSIILADFYENSSHMFFDFLRYLHDFLSKLLDLRILQLLSFTQDFEYQLVPFCHELQFFLPIFRNSFLKCPLDIPSFVFESP